MPYANQHSCRLKQPGAFQPRSFRTIKRKHDGRTYGIIVGRLQGKTAATEQAYRYDTGTWTEDAARTHCEEHGGSFHEAEPEE